MVSSEQIQIVNYILESIVAAFLIITYTKSLFGLRIKISQFTSYIKQLIVFVRLLPHLWMISNENSRNYNSMIEFHPYNGSIKAEDNNPSPCLEFSFSIPNFSIYDFEINKINIDVFYYDMLDSDHLLKRVTTGDMEVPNMQVLHQKRNENRVKFQPLPVNFINILKDLKKEGKENSIKINIKNINIDFNGDKGFRKYWEYNTAFELEIPIDQICITL